MNGLWFAILVVAVLGAVLLARSLRDVRNEVARTVDSFTRFQTTLGPILAVLRDETGEVARRVDLGRPGSAPPRG